MGKIEIVRNLVYATDGGKALLLDLYLPKDCAEFPLFIFFYGGGLEGGCKEEMCLLAEEFAGAGIAFAVPNYRLFPHVSYPVFIEDAARATAWLKAHIAEYGRCTDIFVGGHSAGAYISMMLCFDKSYLGKVGVNADEMSGYIFASGQPTTHFNVLKYRGEDSSLEIIDEAAPIFHIRSSGAPLQIMCSDNDMEGRLAQTRLMVSTLAEKHYDSEVDFRVLEGYDHCSYLERDKDGKSLFFEMAFSFIDKNSVFEM